MSTNLMILKAFAKLDNGSKIQWRRPSCFWRASQMITACCMEQWESGNPSQDFFSLSRRAKLISGGCSGGNPCHWCLSDKPGDSGENLLSYIACISKAFELLLNLKYANNTFDFPGVSHIIILCLIWLYRSGNEAVTKWHQKKKKKKGPKQELTLSEFPRSLGCDCIAPKKL